MTTRREYDQGAIVRMLAESDSASSSDAKGEKLEDLTRYLFEAVAGLDFADRNILDEPRAQEIDLAFWNSPASTLFFFDALFYVECKNLNKPAGSNDVGWFVRKLQDRAAKVAILITLSGITGRNGVSPTSAHDEVVSAMTRDGIKVLVINRQELLGLESPEQLVELLKKKFMQLSLRKIVHLMPPP